MFKTDKKFITEGIIREFENYLYENEKSPGTIEKYVRDTRSFMLYLGENEAVKARVIEYKKLLLNKYAPRSVNAAISSLNAFFDFAGWQSLKVKTVKIQKEIFADKTKELTKNEYFRLLSEAKSKHNERLYYLMQTIGSSGIRVSELRFITCEAVAEGCAVIRMKGKIRRVYLPKALCKMLSGYIRGQKIKSGPVFVTKSGKPLNRSNIWSDMKKLCEKARVPREKVFPHNLRHLFARTYYSLEKDIVRLSDILGHSSMNTTRIYTAETGEVHCRQIQRLGLLYTGA